MYNLSSISSSKEKEVLEALEALENLECLEYLELLVFLEELYALQAQTKKLCYWLVPIAEFFHFASFLIAILSLILFFFIFVFPLRIHREPSFQHSLSLLENLKNAPEAAAPNHTKNWA